MAQEITHNARFTGFIISSQGLFAIAIITASWF